MIIEAWEVQYQHRNNPNVSTATFDDIVGAQLFWDSINYCSIYYKMPLTPRPGYKPDAQLAEWEK